MKNQKHNFITVYLKIYLIVYLIRILFVFGDKMDSS